MYVPNSDLSKIMELWYEKWTASKAEEHINEFSYFKREYEAIQSLFDLSNYCGFKNALFHFILWYGAWNILINCSTMFIGMQIRSPMLINEEV